jgi:OOP family OmpA-OmpF porin
MERNKMNKFKGLIAIFAAAILATGCASLPSEQWKDCAIAGAVAGAAAGVAADDDHDARNGVIGAVIGGAIGAALCSEDEPAPAPAPAKDTDGDGVIDALDNCPNTPTGAKVDSNGCALDTDGDGVADYKDQCPDTPAGAVVNELGCSKPLVLEGVNFELDSDQLTGASEAILAPIAQAHKMYHADVALVISGHTDSTGSDAYNQDLSQRRAESVRAYLVSQGSPADKLSAVGYGESNPVADNGTKEGRAQNRRVELSVK